MAAHASWEEIEEAVLSDSNSPTASGSKPRLDPSQRWRRNDRDVTDLGPERLDDYIQVVKCERCTKPVLARYQGYHKENCDLIHDIKQGRVSPSCLEPEATRKKRRMSDGAWYCPPSPTFHPIIAC
ncbi:hypothetical protein BDZ90DRAFT_133761 [Jaminaea rosea]|uniref:Uncharacterized protein n=1 Tax=Jaminaea rosea TaxID=1569628 RepID=A0A316UX39_9BASI|nr:hypothetical protein BDZ90DRAFT_133761 [Jaminaea rosea]PWN28891.1 hypothetical protein BDZ90DRAFT_133761 [Jaminaea rosea]